MTTSQTAPRLDPLRDDELTDEQKELLEPLGERSGGHVFRTMVRHPKLYRHWSRFSGYLLRRSALEPREREIVILRTAYRCGSAYEWGQHARIGLGEGLTDDEIRRIAAGPDASGWSEHDAALLRAVDELHEQSQLSDATWSQLAERYDEHQLIETIMLSGGYRMLAGALNSIGVQPEGPLAPLGEAQP
jgi:4-carboxymuconolactone decarboxylase